MPFNYRSFDNNRVSVIELDVAEALADRFTAHKIDSCYSTVSPLKDSPTRKFGHVYIWEEHPDFTDCHSLPDFWTCDVQHILSVRAGNRHWAKALEIAEAIENPAIRAYLVPRVANRERGYGTPAAHDLSTLARGATGYKPTGNCRAVLKFKEAVLLSSTQELYADYSTYAIPCEIEAGADRAVCQQNLNAFCQAIKTHNGWAGSGSSYSASIVDGLEGSFILFSGRHSIAD